MHALGELMLVTSEARARRLPLCQRKREARQAARVRIAARTLTVAPAAPVQEGSRLHLAGGLWLLLASLAVHGTLAGVGFALRARGGDQPPVIEQTVTVQVQPPPPEPVVAPAAPAPAPAPPPRPVQRRAPAPKRVAAAPAPAAPPLVVGLSAESTVAGDGPAFVTGDTHEGTTPTIAPPPRPAPPAPSPNMPANLPLPGVRTTLPRRRRNSEPLYPETLKAQGVEADVTVSVSLDAAGRVTGARLVRGSPYPEFDQAALQAARAEEFIPATRDGAPVPTSLSFTYHFRLESQ